MSNPNTGDYAQIARASRIKCLDLIYKAQTSHIGSNFSCADIMAVLFEKIDLDKDKFVLSAGWKAAMLYYHLWRKGRITEEELNSYCQPGSKFIGLAEPIVPEIMIAGGSMGLGLPGAVGLALAKKIKGEQGKVYCLMSDGEMAIGTTWESMLIASHHELDNLVIMFDSNGWQAMGKRNEILGNVGKGVSGMNGAISELGILVGIVDGHNHWDINMAFDYITADHHEVKAHNDRNFKKWKKRPHMISFATTKGKGVSFMENNNLFHYKAPNEEEYLKAKEELK